MSRRIYTVQARYVGIDHSRPEDPTFYKKNSTVYRGTDETKARSLFEEIKPEGDCLSVDLLMDTEEYSNLLLDYKLQDLTKGGEKHV